MIEADDELVTELLGRPPSAAFVVELRRADGTPVVIRNAPFLHDGTPMPTTYWLVDRELVRRIGRLENEGGVKAAEAAVDPTALRAAHAEYAARRDATIPGTHVGPRPSGGVGGTREGVKCLHAHYAAFLVGTGDPVGRWIEERLRATADAATARGTE